MSRMDNSINWFKWVRFTVSVFVLTSAMVTLSTFIFVSAGLIDLSKDPVTDAEQNTTGVPNVTSSEYPSINGHNLEMEIFERVNERRKAHGREPFVHSERVRLISRIHSLDMAKRDFFNHTNPDGVSPPGRHKKYDGCESPNENIVEWESFTTNDTSKIAKEVVASWSNSPAHNSTQLSRYYHVSGVGVYVTENRGIYVTQNFCREHRTPRLRCTHR